MAVTAYVGNLRVKTSSGTLVILYPKTISSQVEGLTTQIENAKIPAPLRMTEAQFTSSNPTLAIGQFAITTDGRNTNRAKIGDGSTRWNSLEYFGQDITLAEYILGESTILKIAQNNTTVNVHVYDANLNTYVQDSNGNYVLKTSIYTE